MKGNLFIDVLSNDWPGPQVSFLVGGGGCRYRRNAVQLLVDGLVVLSVSGQCREQMTRQSWSLQQYIGKRARLRLIDFYGGGWGHINFDDFKGNVTRCTGKYCVRGWHSWYCYAAKCNINHLASKSCYILRQKVVTFRVDFTFCVNCYILRRNRYEACCETSQILC